MKLSTCILLIVCALSLAACGGGGGGGPDAAPLGVASSSFVHRATVGSVLANLSFLDHPLTNDNPTAVVIVTPNQNPDGGFGAFNAHPVGAQYDTSRGRWAVSNVDRAGMVVGTAYNVTVASREGPGATTFARHRVTATSVEGDASLIDHPAANDNPDAQIFATPYHAPGSEGTARNAHVVGVFYSSARGRWLVFNEDNAPMQVDAAFGLAITNGGGGQPFSAADPHRATAANIDGNTTYVDITRRRDAIVHATHCFNPGGGPIGVRSSHPIGVWFDDASGRWGIFNEDARPMGSLTAYSVASNVR